MGNLSLRRVRRRWMERAWRRAERCERTNAGTSGILDEKWDVLRRRRRRRQQNKRRLGCKARLPWRALRFIC